MVVLNKIIYIFIDGLCFGNFGSGGYGVVLIYKGYWKELSYGFVYIINNWMELFVFIEVFNSLIEVCNVEFIIDS